VGTAIYYRYIENVETKVGYAAHFAGAIAGLLVGVNVLRNLQVETWEKVVWWICFVIYVCFNKSSFHVFSLSNNLFFFFIVHAQVTAIAALIAINFLWVEHFPPARH